MASFGSFSSFDNKYKGDKYKFAPIKNEFGGSSPESLYTVNRESCWARWRRGFELATASLYHNSFDYPFKYRIPLPTGVPGPLETLLLFQVSLEVFLLRIKN